MSVSDSSRIILKANEKKEGYTRTERREPFIQRCLIRIIAYPTHEDGFLRFGAFFHELLM